MHAHRPRLPPGARGQLRLGRPVRVVALHSPPGLRRLPDPRRLRPRRRMWSSRNRDRPSPRRSVGRLLPAPRFAASGRAVRRRRCVRLWHLLRGLVLELLRPPRHRVRRARHVYQQRRPARVSRLRGAPPQKLHHRRPGHRNAGRAVPATGRLRCWYLHRQSRLRGFAGYRCHLQSMGRRLPAPGVHRRSVPRVGKPRKGWRHSTNDLGPRLSVKRSG